MKKKGLIIFSILGIALAVGLVVSYAGKVSLLYLNVDEVIKMFEEGKGKELLQREMRLHGYLKPNSTKRLVGRLDYLFEIAEKPIPTARSIQVRYKGILPDTFRDRAELVIEGKFVRPDLFRAHTVLAKCPTKYKEEHPKKYGNYGGQKQPATKKNTN